MNILTLLKNRFWNPGLAALMLALLGTGAQAQPPVQYAKTKDGQRPTPIVAVDNVCAWPNLNMLRDGAIVATIFNQPNHGRTAGDVDCWASTDGGRTWQKRGTPAAHDPDTNRMNVAAGMAQNGDLIVISSGWSNRYPSDRKDTPFRAAILTPWVCRSTDGGRTWAVDKHAFPAKGPRGGDYVPFGNILPGNDRLLRAAIYEPRNLRDERVYIYRSPDDGKTWGGPVALDEDHLRNETALLHLGGGKWLAAARTNMGADPTIGGLQLYSSNDDAKTWQPRGGVVDEPAMHPGHLLRLRDGRILLSYGNRTASRGVDVRFSRDEGKTWSQPTRVADFQEDGGYPSSVQLPDGQVLTAYYASKAAYHNRYHMGVVIWDSAAEAGP